MQALCLNLLTLLRQYEHALQEDSPARDDLLGRSEAIEQAADYIEDTLEREEALAIAQRLKKRLGSDARLTNAFVVVESFQKRIP